MKNNNLPKRDLFRINLTWWILGLVLGFPVMFLLDYFTGRVLYYPGMGDMGPARVKQLQLVLMVLAFLNVITPTIINAIEVFYTDLTRNGNKSQTKRSYFSFAFNLTGIRHPLPRRLSMALMVAEVAFIISIMIYLRQNYYNALSNSLDFLISAPFLRIIVASLLLIVDCSLIFCILVFSFLWGLSWLQWAEERFYPGFTHAKNHYPLLLLASLISRALNMLGLAIIINFMATFSGNFNTVVNLIIGITILLFLWAGVFAIPYLRERITFGSKIAA